MADTEEEQRPSLRPQSMASRGSSSAASLRPQSGFRPGGGLSQAPAARAATPVRDDDIESEDAAAPSSTAPPSSVASAADDNDVDDAKDVRGDPLETQWVFWFDKRVDQGGRSFTDEAQFASNLKIVGEFDTVQDFWRYFNHMRPASDLEFNSNYHLFKSGIKPMWEDPVNTNGGILDFFLLLRRSVRKVFILSHTRALHVFFVLDVREMGDSDKGR